MLFRIPRYFELKIISLGLALQSFINSYLELLLFRAIFPSKIQGFNRISKALNVGAFK